MAEAEKVGRYRIEGVLGRGGMGVVYEAIEEPLDREVALKVLDAEAGASPAIAERLQREGRAQASLEHPHILPVYDAGETDRGPYVAMRLVRGSTLAAMLAAGVLDATRALRLLGQVASALDAAHAAGFVHRDVKPGNVLVDHADQAFLSDFGLAWRSGDRPLTRTGALVGTVDYLAPEVVEGGAPTAASDRYAFAAMLFECLTGAPPFSGDTDAAVLHAHVYDDSPSASERRADLPPTADGAIAAGLAKRPEARPPTATAIVASVAEALGEGAVARLGPPVWAARAAETSEAAAPRGTSRARVLAAVAIATAAGMLGGLLIGGSESAESSPTAPPQPAGTEPIGSALEAPERVVGCRGRPPAPAQGSCTIVQSALEGATLLAPRDGSIRSWSLQGAQGEVALQVFRERDGVLFQVARSQFEVASGPGPHTFPANVEIRRGDRLGLELGHGASIGIQEAAGATTRRWFVPVRGLPGSEATREAEPGSGFDYEVLMRADFTPGEGPELPRILLGSEAAKAPDGKERTRKSIEFTNGATRDVAVVEVGNDVVLDLLDGGRRIARAFVPDLRPGGQIVDFYTLNYEWETAFGELGLAMVNEGSARLIDHFFGVYAREFVFFS